MARSAHSPWQDFFERRGQDPRRVAGRFVAILAAVMIAFSIAPLWNNLRDRQNKDYNLWFRTGQAALHCGWLYPTDNRPFPFMYPPPCAVLLAAASVLGELPFVVVLLLVNSAAWITCIILSVYLVTGRALGQHPLLYLIPTLVVIPFVHDMYLLGQPALLLLACLLGSFACLRVRRSWSAGALIALAAAVKAFPILALGYLVYRRKWKASLATLVSLTLLLLVFPMPLRGVGQTWADLATWTRGMLLKYDESTIAQRPERSYSFKNQSLIALANRLLRSIPADGEAADGWKINVADLGFRSVNAVILLTVLSLCGYYVTSMPRAGRQSERSDAIEVAMLLLLILAFCPLSFDYNFVWLMYPLTVTMHMILDAPAWSRARTAQLVGLLATLSVYALAPPIPPHGPSLR